MRRLATVASLVLFCSTCFAARPDVALLRSKDAAVGYLYLDGPITEKSADLTIKRLEKLASTDAGAVVMEINSPGGEVDAGFKLARTMENLSVPVVCVVDGEAASMAFYLLQSCTVRFMTARSTLMAHGVSYRIANTQGNAEQFSEMSDALKASTLAVVMHVSARMKVTPEQFAAKIAGRAWYMAYKEALEVGAVDSVVPSVNQALELTLAAFGR